METAPAVGDQRACVPDGPLSCACLKLFDGLIDGVDGWLAACLIAVHSFLPWLAIPLPRSHGRSNPGIHAVNAIIGNAALSLVHTRNDSLRFYESSHLYYVGELALWSWRVALAASEYERVMPLHPPSQDTTPMDWNNTDDSARIGFYAASPVRSDIGDAQWLVHSWTEALGTYLLGSWVIRARLAHLHNGTIPGFMWARQFQ